MNILPDNSDTDGDGRIGLFSTYDEIHAFIIGIAAGFVLTSMNNWLDEKYTHQVKQELPYAIGGVISGYILYLFSRAINKRY